MRRLLRTTPDASVDYAHVAADIAELVADVDLRALAFDRWRMDVMQRELGRMCITLLIENRDGTWDSVRTPFEMLFGSMMHGRIWRRECLFFGLFHATQCIAMKQDKPL